MLLKRLFDIFTSLIGLMVLLPGFLIIACLIKTITPGPVFFLQRRVGRNGKTFIICKFRTMKVEHYGSTISIKGESRITSLGIVLRRYKIDELPELWNVFKGEMSLVGPRPDMPEYASRLSGEEKLILSLRPGITGPASIKYANEEELLALQSDPKRYNDEVLWPDKVRINLDYYYNRSFLGDISLIFRTIFSRRNTLTQNYMEKGNELCTK
jgi:lipopolysaccharide/colanic/teichoic acid biosynthesis glycosyltransferase